MNVNWAFLIGLDVCYVTFASNDLVFMWTMSTDLAGESKRRTVMCETCGSDTIQFFHAYYAQTMATTMAPT